MLVQFNFYYPLARSVKLAMKRFLRLGARICWAWRVAVPVKVAALCGNVWRSVRGLVKVIDSLLVHLVNWVGVPQQGQEEGEARFHSPRTFSGDRDREGGRLSPVRPGFRDAGPDAAWL